MSCPANIPDRSIITDIKGSRLPTPRGRPAQNGRKNHLLPSPLIFEYRRNVSFGLAVDLSAVTDAQDDHEQAVIFDFAD